MTPVLLASSVSNTASTLIPFSRSKSLRIGSEKTWSSLTYTVTDGCRPGRQPNNAMQANNGRIGRTTLARCTCLNSLAMAGTQLVECRLETACQLVRRPSSPIMQEVDCWLSAYHVVMDGDDIQSIRAERLENGRDLVRQHG